MARRRTCTGNSLRQLAGDRPRHVFEEPDLHQDRHDISLVSWRELDGRGGVPQDLHQDLSEAAGRRLAPTFL